ncbi:MAG: zf-HC2 domain-containing protein [Terriglobales bacterium]
MTGQNPFEMQCAEFEAVMADVLDETASTAVQARFHAHQESCPNCALLLRQARTGLNWLMALKAEDQVMELPATLTSNILQATSGAGAARARRRTEERSWLQRLRELPGIAAMLGAAARQPRFAMSFAMAFFSIMLLLNLTGFKLQRVRHLDLSPSALVRKYYETEGKLVKYYENIRFVYEVQSRVRELQRAAAPDGTEPNPEEKNPAGPPDRKPGEGPAGAPEEKDMIFIPGEKQHGLAAIPHPPASPSLRSGSASGWGTPTPMAWPDRRSL